MLRRALFILPLLLLTLLPATQADSLALTHTDWLFLEREITGFFNGTEPTIIVGDGLSLMEKTLFKGVIAADPELQAYQFFQERAVTRDALDNDLILLGGKETNHLSRLDVAPSKELLVGPLRLFFYNGTGHDGTGQKKNETEQNRTKRTLVIATTREEKNYPYTGIAKSPLAHFLPPQLVPVAASFLSILLLLLGQLFLRVATDIGKSSAALNIMNWWKRRFADKKARRHLRIKEVHIPVREIIAVLASMLILGLATAWLYAGDYLAVLWSVLPAMVTVGLFRYLLRLWYCHHNGLHIEEILWPLGIAVTVVSVFLGSLFSLASYWRVHKDERNLAAANGWFLMVMTLLLGLFTWIANLLWPSHYLQLVSVLSVTIPFIGLIPIPPLFGWGILKWNKRRWAITFAAALPLYLLVVFASQFFS